MIKFQKDPKFYKFDGIFPRNSSNYEVTDFFLQIFICVLLMKIVIYLPLFKIVANPHILSFGFSRSYDLENLIYKKFLFFISHRIFETETL